MIKISQQELTADLKKQMFDGLSQHAISQTGHDELLEPVAFIAKDKEQFAGGIVVQLFWGALHIKYLFVEDQYRGQKVASLLMQAALDFAKENQCPFAYVETMSFQALEFYQKMGFALDFSRSGFKHGTTFHYLSRKLPR